MKSIITLALIITSAIVSAQNVYYQGSNGKILSEASYTTMKDKLSKTNKIEEEITATRTATDSVIKTVKLTFTPLNTEGTVFDPYAGFKKKKGQHFPIEQFKTPNGKNYKATALNGKPTFINFWFTHCPPCIAEIPNLNNLKAKFGNKVNFISITFDEAETVKKFLAKTPINFEHITNSKPQLTEMGIEGYPMNLLLDKNGNILNVYGEISYDEAEIKDTLEHQLSK